MTRLIIVIAVTLFSLSVKAQTNIDLNQCISRVDTLDKNKVYQIVSKQPKYKGEISQFLKEISTLIIHPKDISGIEGKFIFTFVIDLKGQIRDLCLMKPQGYAFNIIEFPNKNINKWVPGELDGIIVPVRMIVPMIIDSR